MILTPLYKVQLIEKDGKHFYSVNDSPTYLNGVTGILGMVAKEALVPWAARVTAEYIQGRLLRVKGYRLTDRFLDRLFSRAKKQPRFAKERAARIGSNAHAVFDSIIKKNKEVVGITEFIESFAYWLKTEKLRIVQGDTKVASIKYGYGGSLDVLLQDETGRLVIGDFKTGNYIYDSHAYQVAAYSQAFVETYGLNYMPGGVVFRFCKGKFTYERREIADIGISFEGFKAALDLFNNHKYVQYKNRELIKPKKEKRNGQVARSVSERQYQVLKAEK